MTKPNIALHHGTEYRTKYRGRPADGEAGQASVYLILMMGIFLMAAVGFAVDLSSVWFHRQAAQSAADASCVAGAMDMLYLNKGTIASSPSFTPGTAGDCSSSSAAAICEYAGFNGYTATTSAASWGASTAAGAVAVNWSFPTSVIGVKSSEAGYLVYGAPRSEFDDGRSFLHMRAATRDRLSAACHSEPVHCRGSVGIGRSPYRDYRWAHD
jgi:hypothetical protein